MIYIILLSLVLALFPSCDNSLKTRDVYVISVADDAYGSGRNNELKTTCNDLASTISQLGTFSDNTHVYAFISHEGKHFVFSGEDGNLPSFTPYDSEGNRLSSSSDSAFTHFHYGDSTCVYASVAATSTEEECFWDMDDVLSLVRGLKGTIKEDDLIIFTYSGHGDSTGALQTNIKVSGNTLTWTETSPETIIDAFGDISGKKVFFLDSCYSGNFVPAGSMTGTDTFNKSGNYTGSDYIKALENSSLIRVDDALPDFWIMSAATEKQEAGDSLKYENDSPFQPYYGAFTYYLLKALGFNMESNEAERLNSALTFYNVYDSITSSFPTSVFYKQTPRASQKRLDIRLR